MAASSTEFRPPDSVQIPPPADSETTPAVRWFDRSSLTIDAMVRIEGVSEADWWRCAPEGRVCEFFDGTVYMPSPASAEHQDEVGFLFDLFNGYRHERGLGVVRLGPAVLSLGPGQKPEPDLFVLPTPDDPRAVPAVLVLEVLSRSTRSHDLGFKAASYQNAQIPEIVHLDLDAHQLLVAVREAGSYRYDTLESGVWRSAAVPGFWCDVSWLWAVPLPNPRRCLDAILAGLPQ